MKCETLTYSAHVTDYSVSASAPDILGRSFSDGIGAASALPTGLAGFFLRLVAYFHGTLNSYPRLEDYQTDYPTGRSVTIIDTSLDNSAEPLQRVRLNRHLSRRLRWLIKRGRVERSDKMRVATAEDEARCNLSAGQFNEYCIRVYGWSRMQVYGLNCGGRVVLKGGVLSLGLAAMCNARLAPD